ncbi:hypothetical protein CDAR_192951 [Caerostris darwini]|uniref:Uncharacterized protein n=1 Tax=Caerostris darwini TaxID=1538125 RepID=A0AAV4S415_9ARAC|nr:hypothetical protein CDAR_192951 [Caerostris darwini]
MPAEKSMEVLKSKLAKHGLSLKEGIAFITADGTTVMKKVGKVIVANQQLCYAHEFRLMMTGWLHPTRFRAAALAPVTFSAF